MAQILTAFPRDPNGVPLWTEGLIENKSITYVVGTTGATGASTLFTVTGCVIVRVFGVCTSDLTTAGSASSLSVGISGNTAAIIANITDARNIQTGEIFIDTSPATVETLPSRLIIGNGQDIIQTIGTNPLTGGILTYYCIWAPISTDGNVVAA